MVTNDIKIDYIPNDPKIIQTVTQFLIDGFSSSPKKAKERLTKAANAKTIPLTFVCY